jgi:opacity protein-like surface antigen
MLQYTSMRRWWRSAVAAAWLIVVVPYGAQAQGFVSVSPGYNFAGDVGCRSATDCEDKNWTWGGSIGALGSVVGFEVEFTHAPEFTGDRPNPVSVTTFMGNFMLAPKISIVQPYGLVGIGGIKTKAEGSVVPDSPDSVTQVGWTVGGGLLVYLHKHVGLKGDLRYYQSFEALDLLGLDELVRDQNKVDFGRAAFGVVFKF